MNLSIADIEEYLSIVRQAVREDRYEIERNENREENFKLSWQYMLPEEEIKKIIYSLTPLDFSEAVKNRKKRFANEILYVFGKNVNLIERDSGQEKEIELYIKFNKEIDNYVIVISFHEAKHPVKKYFH
ncbi:MAG: hypothetical protein UC204_03615 [Faecalibacterium sp.]|jgi:hypothetical protein|nr:hypothetical protein [Faecalibacterium sp.]